MLAKGGREVDHHRAQRLEPALLIPKSVLLPNGLNWSRKDLTRIIVLLNREA